MVSLLCLMYYFVVLPCRANQGRSILVSTTPDHIRVLLLGALLITVSFRGCFCSVTAGIDALGEVSVRVMDETSGRVFIGKAADTDVIHASATAYLQAVNRLASNRGVPAKAHPQHDVE